METAGLFEEHTPAPAENVQKRNNIPMYITLILLIFNLLIVAVHAVKWTVTYLSGHEITVTDRTGSFMYSRSENWKHIASGQFTIDFDDLETINTSPSAAPIAAELARQLCGVDDDYNFYYHISDVRTGLAYKNLIYTEIDSEASHDETKFILVDEPIGSVSDMWGFDDVTLDAVPVAMDCVVFMTHKDNPVDGLTSEQVQKIYSGEITNWKEVGGNGEKIEPYQRQRGSVCREAMQKFVMGNLSMVNWNSYESYSEKGGGSWIQITAEYENCSNSIGYTNYYYLNMLYRSEDIKLLEIDGIYPDEKNISSGIYPFSNAIYAVTAESKTDDSKDDDSKMLALKDYLLSDEGQEIIRMSGLCPVRTEEEYDR